MLGKTGGTVWCVCQRSLILDMVDAIAPVSRLPTKTPPNVPAGTALGAGVRSWAFVVVVVVVVVVAVVVVVGGGGGGAAKLLLPTQ